MKEKDMPTMISNKNLFCVLNRTFYEVLGGKYNQVYFCFFFSSMYAC